MAADGPVHVFAETAADSEEKCHGNGIRRSEGDPDILKEGEWQRHRNCREKHEQKDAGSTTQFV